MSTLGIDDGFRLSLAQEKLRDPGFCSQCELPYFSRNLPDVHCSNCDVRLLCALGFCSSDESLGFGLICFKLPCPNSSTAFDASFLACCCSGDRGAEAECVWLVAPTTPRGPELPPPQSPPQREVQPPPPSPPSIWSPSGIDVVPKMDYGVSPKPSGMRSSGRKVSSSRLQANRCVCRDERSVSCCRFVFLSGNELPGLPCGPVRAPSPWLSSTQLSARIFPASAPLLFCRPETLLGTDDKGAMSEGLEVIPKAARRSGVMSVSRVMACVKVWFDVEGVPHGSLDASLGMRRISQERWANASGWRLAA